MTYKSNIVRILLLTTNYFVLIELFEIDEIDLDNKHARIDSHVINEIHILAMTNV